MAEKKRAAMSGKNQELYVESAFATLRKQPDKNGEHQPLVNVTFRKRAGVDQDYAGAYIANRENPQDKNRPFHSQLLTVDAFNKIREVNGKDPLAKEDFVKAANEKKPLALGSDNLAFKGTVFSDSRSKNFSHLVNPKSIEKTEIPFDIKKEKEAQVAKREARAKAAEATKEAPAKKATKKAAKAKESEPELG